MTAFALQVDIESLLYTALANAHLFPKQKFAIEQPIIAMALETSRGSRASWTSNRITVRFPTIETKPLERWKRAN